MPEVVKLYKCLLCDKAYDSRQALRGHVRIHKGGFVRTTFYLPKGDYEAFKAACDRHNSTTCHVISAMMKAWIQGEKSGLVTMPSSNPVIFQVSQYFMGKPRSALKALLESRGPLPGSFPSCSHIQMVDLAGLEAWCSGNGGMVSLAVCERCNLSMRRIEVRG